MTSTEAEPDGSLGTLSYDFTIPSAATRDFDTFMDGWDSQLGDDFPQPTYSAATIGDFRVKTRAARLRDAALTDVHAASAVRTAGAPCGGEDKVRLYVIRHGAWTMSNPSDRAEHTIPAGQFLIRHVGRPLNFTTVPYTTAKILVLPAATLKPLIGNRILTGPASSAEVRLLAAHTNMIYATMADLSPAGVQAAHSTLIELAKAVATRQLDDMEPRLAPALAQAAKNLANSRLADAELSPMMLARELNVSIRTLQRAFAEAGESVTAYIRHRRLEEARLALTTPANHLSVTELAAHWQFADSSHFTRAFKKRYGQTPSDYARSRPKVP